MMIKALVAVAETDFTYPVSFITEPKPGQVIPLNVDGVDGEFVAVEVEPVGFDGSSPYMYTVYVKPKK